MFRRKVSLVPINIGSIFYTMFGPELGDKIINLYPIQYTTFNLANELESGNYFVHGCPMFIWAMSNETTLDSNP